ncbi:hypothetical protein NC652_036301 [Populus alba x Populus x berolinensis]|nr:hypothetical protein NC652_036301 [Populus alba x Populus x berolinensis]
MIIWIGRWLGNEETGKTLVSSTPISDGVFGEQLSEQWSGSKLPAWAWQKFQLDGEQRHSTVTARLRPHKEVVILKRRRQVNRRSNPVHYQLWRLKIHEGFSMTSSYVL